MNGQVGRNNGGIGEYCAQSCHGARLSAAGKAVYIEDFLARHEVGELFYVGIFHALLLFRAQIYKIFCSFS